MWISLIILLEMWNRLVCSNMSKGVAVNPTQQQQQQQQQGARPKTCTPAKRHLWLLSTFIMALCFRYPYPLINRLKLCWNQSFGTFLLSVVILWLPTFWSSKILWPPYCSFQKIWPTVYLPPPLFRRKWKPPNLLLVVDNRGVCSRSIRHLLKNRLRVTAEVGV